MSLLNSSMLDQLLTGDQGTFVIPSYLVPDKPSKFVSELKARYSQLELSIRTPTFFNRKYRISFERKGK